MKTNEKIIPGGCAKGEITVPGDKSISIRALLFSAIARDTSNIAGLGQGEDIQSALKCINALGIETSIDANGSVAIKGNGLYGLKPTNTPIDCSNSGTTLRILTGILAGQKNTYVLTGDSSLQKRPMDRILIPLRMMGAHIDCSETEGNIPYTIFPSDLHSILYIMPVASAQVKSAILLAGLYAQGQTTVEEPILSRNHTEQMLSSCGVTVCRDEKKHRISVTGAGDLKPLNLNIPGDVSSAAFFIVLATLLPGSHLIIKNVGMNNTRTGVIEVLRDMGANITVHNPKIVGGEDAADLEIIAAPLKGTTIEGDMVPRIIDEIPVLAVAGAFAQGRTAVRDASELRVKETDRIHAVCHNLKKMGIIVDELPDGFVIKENENRKSAEFDSFGDHRIAMAFAVAGTVLEGSTIIHESQWADISYPGFFTQLNQIRNLSIGH